MCLAQGYGVEREELERLYASSGYDDEEGDLRETMMGLQVVLSTPHVKVGDGAEVAKVETATDAEPLPLVQPDLAELTIATRGSSEEQVANESLVTSVPAKEEEGHEDLYRPVLTTLLQRKVL